MQLALYNPWKINESCEKLASVIWRHFLNMYIIYIALLSCGLQFSYTFFLVTYVVLIPFQMKMNQYKRMFIEAGIYIRLIYEDNNKDGWETFHFKDDYIKIHKKGKWYLMVGTGSTQLGILSTILYIFFVIKDNLYYQISFANISLILLSILLLGVLTIVNWKTTKVIDIYAYENILKKYKNEKKKSKKK